MVDREIVTAIWLTAKGLILMARKKKTNLTLSDGFDKVTGKFDTAILKKMYPDARYYFILGGRGWGKTYPTIRLCLEDALKGEGAFAYVRRYKDSISDTYIQDLMGPHNEWLATQTFGEWNRIGYWRKRWSFELWDNKLHQDGSTTYERVAKAPIPFAGAFAMNTWETSKGPDFGADKNGVKNIIIDEALSAGGDYLSDEWGKFQNVISSLVRENYDKDTKIWLLANPVSKYNSPYFRNLGITKKMMKEPGVTEIKYPPDEYGHSMSCVFCYLGEDKEETRKKASAKDLTYSTFFAFPNSKGKSRSITHGTWELEDSNQLPSKVFQASEEILQTYFVMDEDLIGCKIMESERGVPYIFFYPASKMQKDTYYFTLFCDLSEYAIIGCGTGHPVAKVFDEVYKTNQVYYSDNSTADMVHGWMLEAKKRKT